MTLGFILSKLHLPIWEILEATKQDYFLYTLLNFVSKFANLNYLFRNCMPLLYISFIFREDYF
jgi:hypothetical protein